MEMGQERSVFIASSWLAGAVFLSPKGPVYFGVADKSRYFCRICRRKEGSAIVLRIKGRMLPWTKTITMKG